MVYDPNRRPGDRDFDYGRDYGSGRDYSYSSAREFEAAGEMDDGRRGGRDFGYRGYEDRERMYGGPGYGRGRGRGFDDRATGYYGGGEPYRGSYAHDGRRFAEYDRDDDRDYGRERGGYGRDDRRGVDRDRGFFDRAADEVRSWFGGDDRDDRGRYGGEMRGGRRVTGDWGGDRVHDHRDRHYHEWRQGQISQLDRDYDEYRREHQSKFDNEFSSWRTNRQGQRQMLGQVREHAEVFGSDGEKVGTVDHVRGDRIQLTKNDPEAGGHHHSIPSSWIQSVEGDRVTLSKSATEAKTLWRDDEYQSGGRGMFSGDGGREHSRSDQGRSDENRSEPRDNQGRILNRSFSGTYDEK